MTTFVALLRGINVGKAKRVPMADLRALLEARGFDQVATLLNSGNAVFRVVGRTARELAEEICAALEARFRFPVPVVVKSAQELAAIVAENTLAAQTSDPSHLLVAFTQDAEALDGLAVLEPLVVPPELFVLGRSAAYFYFPAGSLESKAGEALLGRAGRATTTRNWSTVLKLQAAASRVET